MSASGERSASPLLTIKSNFSGLSGWTVTPINRAGTNPALGATIVPGTGRFKIVWAETSVGGKITLVENVSAISRVAKRNFPSMLSRNRT